MAGYLDLGDITKRRSAVHTRIIKYLAAQPDSVKELNILLSWVSIEQLERYIERQERPE